VAQNDTNVISMNNKMKNVLKIGGVLLFIIQVPAIGNASDMGIEVQDTILSEIVDKESEHVDWFPEEGNTVKQLGLELRGEADYYSVDGETDHDNTGIKGTHLNFVMQGRLFDKFSYRIRHRINRSSADGNFFDATDFALLRYHINDKFTVDFGKRAMALAGIDVDYASIDIMITNQFNSVMELYEWGTGFNIALKKSNLYFEIVQSPYWESYGKRNIYAYSVMWSGNHSKNIEFMYSVNLMESHPGNFIGWLALGHRINLNRFVIEADIHNRASFAGSSSSKYWLFRNMSFIGALKYMPLNNLTFALKGTYDFNTCDEQYDYDVYTSAGTDCGRVGFYAEYFPIKNESVRIHAACYTDFGSNTSRYKEIVDKSVFLSAGLTWRIDFLKFFKNKTLFK